MVAEVAKFDTVCDLCANLIVNESDQGFMINTLNLNTINHTFMDIYIQIHIIFVLDRFIIYLL